jgi:hypothetical protein
MRRDKVALGVLAILVAVLAGRAREQRADDRKGLLDDFRKADAKQRIELLPRLTAIYRDDELPSEARYLLALQLLRPHLTWHAPHLEKQDRGEERVKDVEDVRQSDRGDGRWFEALGPEPWMGRDIPKAVRADARAQIADLSTKGPDDTAFFWRLRNPGHPDVTRARKLLESVTDEAHSARAHRWATEIARDNTVLTLDVTGSYEVKKNAPVVVDVRNADHVTFRLYRVREPAELLWTTGRIGTDFVYHDHGLQYDVERLRQIEKFDESKLGKVGEGKPRDEANKVPAFLAARPEREWSCTVADLKKARSSRWERRHRDDDDDYRAPDSDYFGDECWRHRDRVDKTYRPKDIRWTSWYCDRIVEVPGDALTEPGAYVLAAQANGQTVYAPLVVDPLSLTLRRCRDGVLVVVADPTGTRPQKAATIHGRDMVGEATTNEDGVAFARLYAGGDRAVIVHKDGRYAVGGFGRVFEGIYVSPLDRLFKGFEAKAGAKRAEGPLTLKGAAQVYADRHVIAAYTDRPTYRPDQDVQFKIIIRRLKPQPADKPDRPFRADEFDFASRLELPDAGEKIPYALLDSRNRAVATGELTLSDFGTAAGKARLSAEAATGSYALRLRIAGVDRVVPDVCEMQYYRLPTFKLDVAGVPDKVNRPEELTLRFTGEYYFGKPVGKGRIEAALLGADSVRPIVDETGVLDEAGKLTLKLQRPKDLAPGRYVVRCTLTDDSGRDVKRVLPYVVVEPERAKSTLAALPRFWPHDRPLTIPTTVDVSAEQRYRVRVKEEKGEVEKLELRTARFDARDGKAIAVFPAPGWYTLTADRDTTDIFIFGGTAPPAATWSPHHQKQVPRGDDDVPGVPNPSTLMKVAGWIDLGDDRNPEYVRRHRPGDQMLALFDRHDAKVGEPLRILAYLPFKRSRLLLTMEGFTVVDYRIAQTTDWRGHYVVVEVPITRRHLPHFYLRGRVLSHEGGDEESFDVHHVLERLKDLQEGDNGSDPRGYRIDVTDPRALPGGEKLRVSVTADKAVYKPGDKVDVNLRVTDVDGKPCAAEVSLAAVDASVYSFGEDRLGGLAALFDDPHPASRFYGKSWRSSVGHRVAAQRLLAMRQDDAIQQLEKATKSSEGKEGMIGEGKAGLRDAPLPPLQARGEMPVAVVPLSRVRGDLRETAAWLPQLRTDKDGKAAASFKLPDTLTSYRLSAVALTKQTEIGTGRAEVRATLPLATQLFLPRFAVETDRLDAVGLVHNNGTKERTCTVRWHVTGATADGPEKATVTVAAGKSASVVLPVKFDRVGQATVIFRCEDGDEGDAEQRELPVRPLGREKSIGFDGTFTGRTTVRLPARFAAQDIRIVLSRNEAARGLDGVAGLVDYPYGCVEQTMSRFLPAVLIRAASKDGVVSLPPDIAKRLPDVLEQGLTRLYNFQHADGGWGWWEHDKSDPRMTAYVVEGLARCRAAGVTVGAAAIERGAAWLKREMKGEQFPPPLVSRAWLALALAGSIDKDEFAAYVRQLTAGPAAPADRLRVALACRAFGWNDRSEKLWSLARTMRSASAEETALLLNAMLVFGEERTVRHQTAASLLKLRHGLAWDNTVSTAAALEALTLFVKESRTEPVPTAVRIAIADAKVLTLTTAEELKPCVYRAHLRENLSAKEDAEIVLEMDGGATAFYTIEATGVQTFDAIPPVGDALKITRSYETLDGKPLDAKITAGQSFAVRVRVELAEARNYLLIEDRRPAGCEFADDRLHGTLTADLAHVEFRDDRVCAFATSLAAGKHEFVYYLRAETPGVFHVLPGRVCGMYQDAERGETGENRLEIVAAKR